MQTRQEGLTTTYNRFHNQRETSEDIQHLRDLHREMDATVAVAYGWDDLVLGHDFYETKQGWRYTISEEARRVVLGRLLTLNHERYAGEVAAGLHDKGAKAARSAKTAAKRAPRGPVQARVTEIAAMRDTRVGEIKKVAESGAAYEIRGMIVKPRSLFDQEEVRQTSLFDQPEE